MDEDNKKDLENYLEKPEVKEATAERIERLKTRVKEFPITSGVYLMKNHVDKIIYVGKAKDLKARVRSYLGKSSDLSVKTKYLVAQIQSIDYLLTKTEVEAFLLEASLIKKYRPRYNIRLKDDKSYPYIRVSMADDFPRFYLARRVKKDGAYYFGPYTQSSAVRETIAFLNRTFKIRDCADGFFKTRKRPCMTHQIGRCTAPCVDLISKKDYRSDVDSALDFLRGQDQKVLKKLTRQMKEEAGEEHFEAAARLRDSINAVQVLWEKQATVFSQTDADQDVIEFFGDARGTLIEVVHVRKGRVIGKRQQFIPKLDATAAHETPKEWLTSFMNQYYSENIVPDEILMTTDLGGDLELLLNQVFEHSQDKRTRFIHTFEEKQFELVKMAQELAEQHFKDQVDKSEKRLLALQEIQAKLQLPALPFRMECFDISNFQGKDSVASQVVFEDGSPKTDDYRRYKIKTVEGSNDFASMKEVLSRRFKHTEYDDPQLIVIDGGKGQLKLAMEALKELGRDEIPIVGMAKARTQGEFSDAEVESTDERFFLPGRQNPVTFRRNAEALMILTNLRDEAHRFAITYHRKLREDRTLASELDQIVGLGPRRKQALLKRFQSIDDIKIADISQISELPGFNKTLAEKIILQLKALDTQLQIHEDKIEDPGEI